MNCRVYEIDDPLTLWETRRWELIEYAIGDAFHVLNTGDVFVVYEVIPAEITDGKFTKHILWSLKEEKSLEEVPEFFDKPGLDMDHGVIIWGVFKV